MSRFVSIDHRSTIVALITSIWPVSSLHSEYHSQVYVVEQIHYKHFELPFESPIWFDDFGVHCTKHETGTQRWYWYDLEVRKNEVVLVQTMTLQIKWIEKRAVNSKWKLWLHQQNTNLCVYGISAYEYKNKTRLPIKGVPVDIELDLHSVLQNKIQL